MQSEDVIRYKEYIYMYIQWIGPIWDDFSSKLIFYNLCKNYQYFKTFIPYTMVAI
jgi:hypothetical protein